jgi:hypothetical protein
MTQGARRRGRPQATTAGRETLIRIATRVIVAEGPAIRTEPRFAPETELETACRPLDRIRHSANSEV